MKKSLSTLFLLLCLVYFGKAQSIDSQKLIELDKGWEKALLTSDVNFLENLLAAGD